MILWLSVQSLYGFGEEKHFFQLIRELHGKIVKEEKRGDLLYFDRKYLIQIPLEENSSALVEVNLRHARLPIGEGKVWGKVVELKIGDKVYRNIFKFKGESKDFKKIEYMIEPTSFSHWTFPKGWGYLQLGKKVTGILNYSFLQYRDKDTSFRGNYLRIEFEVNNGRIKKLITIGTGVGRKGEVRFKGDSFNLFSLIEGRKAQLRIFVKKLVLMDNRSKIQINRIQLGANIVGKREYPFILTRKALGEMSYQLASSGRAEEIIVDGMPMGYLQFQLSLLLPVNEGIATILRRGWSEKDSLNLQIEGSERVLKGLSAVFKNPVTAFLWDNLQRRGDRYGVQFSVNRGEVSINGKRTLP
jgi:hypothetical protein